LYTWGDNTHGQLGNGTTDSHRAPVQVSGISQIVDVAAGSNHVLVLSAASGYRQIYVWGDNSLGQLGLGGQKATASSNCSPYCSTSLAISIRATSGFYLSQPVIRSLQLSGCFDLEVGQPTLKNELYLWGLTPAINWVFLTRPAAMYRHDCRAFSTVTGDLVFCLSRVWRSDPTMYWF
jgi:hypothetical protein